MQPLRVLLVALLAVCQGCASLLTVKGPPSGHEQLPFVDCSARYTAPVVDTALATFFGGVALVALLNRPAEEKDPQTARLIMTTLALWTAVGAGSAAYGYWKVGSCREARDALARRTTTVVPRAPWPPNQ
jgi:hypothetical protein